MMNSLRTARRSARAVAVGAVAALGLAASATGTAVAAQPAQDTLQTPTYTCAQSIQTFGLVTAFDCTATDAPQLGTITSPFDIVTPSGTLTCDSGIAVVPVVVVGFGCANAAPVG